MLNLPCREIGRLSSERLDRNLDWSEQAAVRSHVVYCIACRRFDRQVQIIREAMLHVEPSDTPLTEVLDRSDLEPRLTESARKRLEEAIRQARSGEEHEPTRPPSQ